MGEKEGNWLGFGSLPGGEVLSARVRRSEQRFSSVNGQKRRIALLKKHKGGGGQKVQRTKTGGGDVQKVRLIFVGKTSRKVGGGAEMGAKVARGKGNVAIFLITVMGKGKENHWRIKSLRWSQRPWNCV